MKKQNKIDFNNLNSGDYLVTPECEFLNGPEVMPKAIIGVSYVDWGDGIEHLKIISMVKDETFARHKKAKWLICPEYDSKNLPEQAAQLYAQKLGEAGTQKALAERFNASQPHISKWIKKGVVIIDGVLYAPITRRGEK